MPSISPGFEYDIFISYRQNDNRSGWVTEFVNALQEELASTIKEPVSVYFDSNPHDGLLETHNVDKSLEGKLKCLIFIPIISQTYCDPKSFAWQHEFCAFNKLSKEDQFGRDIKLSNGNVSSRILPIKIHDLDPDDKAAIENEINGVLRSIEFIYKSAGVNRPLRVSEDNPQDNVNKTFYRDQVNKVANAIKEIISSLKSPITQANRSTVSHQSTAKPNRSKRLAVALLSLLAIVSVAAYFFYPKLFPSTKPESAEQSIAVLSFVDMSPNKDQEYLGDGIAEEILNSLTKITGLKVIGRTSSFSFKGKDTSLKIIGETLGATTLLEGSIQKSGNKIRVTAQLINAVDETHIWSEQYESEEDDIFSIQDDIVTRIIQKLKGSFALNDSGQIKIPTSNLEAYEMLLKGRYYRSQGVEWQERALEYYRQAIAIDPSFAQAYTELSGVYWNMGLFGLADQKESLTKSKEAALKAISLDGSSYYAYNMLAYLYLTVDWDIPSYLKNYEKAVLLGLPLPDPWHFNYEQWILLKHDKAIKEAEFLVEKDPLSVEALVNLSRVYLYARKYEDVIRIGRKVLQLSPDQSSIFRHTGEAYLFTGRPELALPYFERLMQKNPHYSPQNFVAVHVKLGNRKVALEKFNELKDTMSPAKRAICYIYLGEIDNAFVALEEACREKDVNVFGIQADHHIDAIRSDPRYPEIVRKTNTLE